MPPPRLRFVLCTFFMFVLCLEDILAQSTCAFMIETPFDLKTVSNEPITPTNLTVCRPSKSSTCCTSDVEAQMKQMVKEEIETAVHDQVILVKKQLQHFGQLFRGHFRAALNITRTRLDRLFTKSYGPFYLQHQEMFDDFFTELDTYYTSEYTYTPVTDIIDRLFKRLFITMFTLMNPLKPPGVVEKECMAQQMETIKPFGGYPSKMSKHVEHAFTSWKFVGKVMDRGVAELLELLSFKTSDECVSSLTKMRHCHVCSGVSPVTKPCPGFCLNVLKGCFAGIAEIDPQWNRYLQALVRNSERLGEVFNPRHVFAPVPIQISEAVMNFQEKGAVISNRVIATCFNNGNELMQIVEENNNKELEKTKESDNLSNFYGFFAALRRKRATPKEKNILEKTVYYSSELHLDSFESKSSSQEAIYENIKHYKAGDDAGETVQHFIDMLIRMKYFFRHLSSTLCADRKIAAPQGDPVCWNGQQLGRYTRRVVGDGIASQRSNPEFVFVDGKSTRESYINVLPLHLRPTTKNTHLSQRLTFAALSEKLNALYRGQLSKEMADYVEEDFDGSGNFINPDDEDNYVIGSGLPAEDVDKEHEAVEQAHRDAMNDYNNVFDLNFNEIDVNPVAAERLPIGFVALNNGIRSYMNGAICVGVVIFLQFV